MSNDPHRSREYIGHVIDSRRWNRLEHRDDDIVVTTAYKAGTTWMQTIVCNLLFPQSGPPHPVMEMSPWVDAAIRPLEETLQTLARQSHRRVIKTHLALDGLPFHPQVKYVYVGRDLRDVFMSIWNHHAGYSNAALERFRQRGSEIGLDWPDCPADAKTFWDDWIDRGSFAWESEGYPYWSPLHHLRTWWDFAHLPNILFVHYNDLLCDLAGQIRRVADYLGLQIDAQHWPRLVDAATFDSMRDNATMILGEAAHSWRQGAKTFLYRGTNGRWRELLDTPALERYRAAMARNLTPDAAYWLEHGGPQNITRAA